MKSLMSFLNVTIDAQGIDNHELPVLRIGSFGAVITTQKGKAILVCNQYAYHGRGQSIHSSQQLEDNNIIVDDRPATLGGSQSLLASDGHIIPLSFVNGLARLQLRPFTDDEWNNLPHVTMTRNVPWSPHRYDSIERMNNIAGPELSGLEH